MRPVASAGPRLRSSSPFKTLASRPPPFCPDRGIVAAIADTATISSNLFMRVGSEKSSGRKSYARVQNRLEMADRGRIAGNCRRDASEHAKLVRRFVVLDLHALIDVKAACRAYFGEDIGAEVAIGTGQHVDRWSHL